MSRGEVITSQILEKKNSDFPKYQSAVNNLLKKLETKSSQEDLSSMKLILKGFY